MSAVLSAPPPRTSPRPPMDAPSRATMASPPPPTRLRSALLYAMGILSASTLADRAQYGARPLEPRRRPLESHGARARHSASAVTRGCPRASRRS